MPAAAPREPDARQRRIEIFIYGDEPNLELQELLAGLGAYPFERKTFLGVGHLIPGLEGVVSGSPLTDIVLVPALQEPEVFRTLHLGGQQHVDVVWAVPIYAAERHFAREHGWRALVKLFIEHKISAADFQRKPVV